MSTFPATRALTETLVGVMKRVTLHNAEIDFSVLRVEVRGQRDLLAVVGHFASMAANLDRLTTQIVPPALVERPGA